MNVPPRPSPLHRPRSRPACPAPAHLLAALIALLMPLKAPGETLTVTLTEEETVRRAVAASHTLEAARHRIARAASGLAAAEAARRPTLAAGAQVSYRSDVPEFAAPIAGPGQPSVVLFPSIRSNSSFSLELSQPLYTGGALSARHNEALREHEAIQAAVATARLDVAAAARTAYWRGVAALAGTGIADTHLRRTRTFLEQVRSLRAAGLAVEADVLAAESRCAAAQLALLRARRAVEESFATLRSLLDVPPDSTLALLDASAPSPPPPPADAATEAEAARRQRPELAGLRARLAELTARAAAGRAGARPSLGASAAWELARPNPRFLPLEDRWQDSWTVGVAGRWTFWDGGRTAAEVASREAERRAVSAEFEELRRGIVIEVEYARLALEAELAAGEAAEASRAAASERLRAVLDRHAAGLATTTEVLDAQAELAAAEGEQVLAATAARLAAARLARAVGQ